MPIHLHPIPQRHPQLRLFRRLHRLPPLLNTRQCRIANSVRVDSRRPLTHHRSRT